MLTDWFNPRYGQCPSHVSYIFLLTANFLLLSAHGFLFTRYGQLDNSGEKE
jgi:hypothetical protein